MCNCVNTTLENCSTLESHFHCSCFRLFVSDFVSKLKESYTFLNDINVSLQDNNGKYKPSDFHVLKKCLSFVHKTKKLIS